MDTQRLLPRPLRSVAAWALALTIIGVAGYLALNLFALLSLVLVPCIIAILLTALLQPINQLLRRGTMAHALAAALTIIICFVVLSAIGFLVTYVFQARFDELSDQFSKSLDHFQTWLNQSGLPVGHNALDHLQDKIQKSASHAGSGLASAAKTAATTVVHVVVAIFLVIFILFFLLYDGERIFGWLIAKAPEKSRSRLHAAGAAAWVTVSGYARGTLVIAVIHACIIGLALYIIGVPVAVPLALLVFLGGFIPIAGVLIAGGVAVLVTLGTQGLLAAVILLAILLIENQVEDHVLQPFVVGRFVRLHPLVIVLVITAGTYLGGIFGAIIAVPVTGVAAIIWAPLRGRPSALEGSSPNHHRVRRGAGAIGRGSMIVVDALRRVVTRRDSARAGEREGEGE